MGISIYTTTEIELSNLICVAVAKALKEHQPQARADNTILTQIETAQLLKISLPTLQAMKAKGLIPYTKIQRKIYFKKQDVLTALETLCTKSGRG